MFELPPLRHADVRRYYCDVIFAAMFFDASAMPILLRHACQHAADYAMMRADADAALMRWRLAAARYYAPCHYFAAYAMPICCRRHAMPLPAPCLFFAAAIAASRCYADIALLRHAPFFASRCRATPLRSARHYYCLHYIRFCQFIFIAIAAITRCRC